MCDKQKLVLETLGFTPIRLPEAFTKGEKALLVEALMQVAPKDELADTVAVIKDHIRTSQFIEQTGLGGELRSGFGVCATLADGSSFYRRKNLLDLEREQLIVAGLVDNTLLAASRMATRH